MEPNRPCRSCTDGPRAQTSPKASSELPGPRRNFHRSNAGGELDGGPPEWTLNARQKTFLPQFPFTPPLTAMRARTLLVTMPVGRAGLRATTLAAAPPVTLSAAHHSFPTLLCAVDRPEEEQAHGSRHMSVWSLRRHPHDRTETGTRTSVLPACQP